VDSFPETDWCLEAAASQAATDPWSTRWNVRARELESVDATTRAAGRVATTQGFVLTRAQALAAGVSAGTLRGLIRRGKWAAVRRNVVSVVTAKDVEDRIVIAAAAAALSWPGAVISHQSAAIVHGLPVLARPIRPIVTVTLNDSTGRRGEIHSRRAALSDEDLAAWYGSTVTSAARTVIDLARHRREEGLVAADAALRRRLCTREELLRAAAGSIGWPGARSARWVVANANPLSESPLESLIRACLLDHGIPLPELQVWIEDGRGWRCRVDALWREQRVILEADGKVKYASSTARGDALWAEKCRQERLERLGFRVVRVSWDEVTRHPTQLVERVRRALRGA
jgi:very-short-patch-repair endonuclease